MVDATYHEARAFFRQSLNEKLRFNSGIFRHATALLTRLQRLGDDVPAACAVDLSLQHSCGRRTSPVPSVITDRGRMGPSPRRESKTTSSTTADSAPSRTAHSAARRFGSRVRPRDKCGVKR